MKTSLPLLTLLGVSLGLAMASLASAQLSDPMLWKVNLGPEVPGAAASAENGSDDGAEFVGLDYDFSNGGGYVALTNPTLITDPIKELRFQVHIDTPHNIAVRLVDSQGEVFQYTIDNVNPGEWSDQRIKTSEASSTRFMASEETGNQKIDYPIREVWLILENNPREESQGKVKFRKVEVK